MAFTILAEEGRARAGVLATAHGKAETPFFMAVATRSSGKYITMDDYASIGQRTLIANGLINYLKPGLDIIDRAGGLHAFMRYPHVLFTDSGGFQMSSSFYEGETEKGLLFRSPFNRQRHRITPKESMTMQLVLGADVAMVLDNMPPIYSDEASVLASLEKTHRWAQECLATHQELLGSATIPGHTIHNREQLLFGICQGGLHPELRRRSASFISGLEAGGKGFDGIAIGGLAIGETQREMVAALGHAIDEIPKERPRYLMGVGNPADILIAVEQGVDLFDSIYPTRNARHTTLFSWQGKMDLGAGRYSEDFGPLEEGCGCMTCRNFTRAYLHHLIKIGEPAVKRLLQYHNLWFMQRFMERIRSTIREGTFMAFKRSFLSTWRQAPATGDNL